jgi:HlyD family secretion protein
MKIKVHLTKKQKKLLIIIVAAVCLVGAAVYTVFIQPSLSQEKWIYKESEVFVGDMTIGITESGTLEYGETEQLYDISVSTSDEEDEDTDEEEDEDEETIEKYLKIEELYIVVGQRISEGDPVIKFTEDSIEDVRKLLTSALTEANIEYSEAKTEYDVDVLSAKQTYQSSMISEGYASKIYNQNISSMNAEIYAKKAEILELSGEIEDLEDAIDDVTEELSDAKETYDLAVEYLANANFSDVGVYVDAQTIYLNAESKYEFAQKNYDEVYESIESKQEEIEDLEDEITAANAELGINEMDAEQNYDMTIAEGSIAESIYNTSIAALEETLNEAAADVEAAEEQLNNFEEFVGAGTIYAEGTGIVTTISYEEGDSLVEEGSIFTYAKEDNMSITVDVSQEDVIDILVGDEVAISFLAYEEEVYYGIISSITTTSTSDSSATVSYPVTVDLLGDTSALYGGMTADITFVTETRENTKYVSENAIVTENDSTYVYVKKLGRYELQEVTTGLSDGIYVEILDGLSDGDIIYIATKVTESANDTLADVESDDSSEEMLDDSLLETSEGENGTNDSMEIPGGDMPDGEMPSGERPEGMEGMN